MKLFSKAKILFHDGTKKDLFDGRKSYLVDGGNKEDLFDGGKKEALPDDGENYKDLFYHVWDGDVDYINRVDPNVLLKARDKDGNTALLIAAKMCYANLYRLILKKCPQLLYQENNYSNITVLHQAKLSFCSIDFFVSTGLNEAVTSNNYMKFMMWMKMRDSKGDTALVHAVRHHNLQAVKRFVEVDRQYNLGLSKVIGFDGKTAVDCAVEIQNLEMVNILLGSGDPHPDNSIAVDLFHSLKSGQGLDYIKTVEVNLLLNSRGKDGMSVLCIATKWDQLDCCEEILKRCPSLLYHHDNKKWSVLHHAAYDGLSRLIDFFVNACLTDNMILFQKWTNLQNRDGDTALILAVNSCNNDIVKRFAFIDRQYKLGLSEIVGSGKMTALQWATHFEDHEMINMLTSSGDCSGTEGNNTGDDDESLQTGNCSGTEGKDVTTDSIASSLTKLASENPQAYSRVQLKEFTKDFSQPLGSGGFGDVYKGQFPDGVFIAVKVLRSIEFKEKVMDEQFVAEVRTGRAYHRNIIKLYGYCYEANPKFKALVYDYMENGSFDRILFEKKLDIPWPKLHNIAKEIAQGISYLHESCSPQIIHHDIKPSNVLLDFNLSPKIIDFGLAKVINMGDSQFEQTKIKGSRGYMAPEVNQQKKVELSCKLDVYSFGMMLFDILGSKRNHVDKRWFPGQVWDMYKAGQIEKFILDCGIKEEDKKNAERLATIALLCVEHNPRTRPKLSNVVKMLEGEIVQLQTPAIPFSRDYIYSSESCSTSDTMDD